MHAHTNSLLHHHSGAWDVDHPVGGRIPSTTMYVYVTCIPYTEVEHWQLLSFKQNQVNCENYFTDTINWRTCLISSRFTPKKSDIVPGRCQQDLQGDTKYDPSPTCSKEILQTPPCMSSCLLWTAMHQVSLYPITIKGEWGSWKLLLNT